MQRKDDSSTTRRDRRIERRLPASEASMPLEAGTRARVTGMEARTRPSEPAPGRAASRPSIAEAIRHSVGSRSGLRQALVLNEILGPPVALRDRSA